MKKSFTRIIILIFFLQIPVILFADRSDRYQRKSISYLNTLFVTDQSIILPPKYSSYLRREIRSAVEMERFDYNPLPDKVLERFHREAKRRGHMNLREMEELLQTTIAPELLAILNLNKEMRAAGLVTEVQRNQFISLKARELGITGDQLRQIMNSAFVYIPVVTEFSVKKKEKKIDCVLRGGVIWFRFEVGEDTTRFVKYKEMLTIANTTVEKDEGKWKAFENAVFILTANLKVMTRSLGEFRLSASIRKVKGNLVYFPLGKREGIKKDDPYFVGEWFQEKSGKVVFRKDGFVRVGRIADNTSDEEALSNAWAIKRGYWVKGMTLKEHPRLPLDLAIRPKYYPLTLESGTLFRSSFIAFEFEDYDAGAYGLDADLQLNLAPFINRSQTFFIGGASFGLTGIDFTAREQITGNDWEFTTFPVMSFTGGHLGYMKKHYLRRFALHYLVTLGVQQIMVSEDIDDKKLSLIHREFGASLALGLEFALNIDTNIGFEAGYRAYPVGYWLLRYGNKEKDFEIPVDIFNPEKPKVYSDNFEFSLYIHYSLPSLSWFSFPGFKPSKIGKFVWENL